MHLDRARAEHVVSRGRSSGRTGPTTSPHRLIGVTLPGVPAVVVGSNTHVAWGFTNSQGDWSDIVLLEIDPHDPNRYRTPEGWRRSTDTTRRSRSPGGAPRKESVRWTIWGPVMPPDHKGRFRAYRWVAHDADRLAARSRRSNRRARSRRPSTRPTGSARPARTSSSPIDNGRIGWTIYGAIPRRVGFDGRIPTSWADGTRGWNGWLNRDEYPRIVDPPSGRIWTANARVVDGDMLAKLGDGNYEVGSRARIIRERLESRTDSPPHDLLTSSSTRAPSS